MLLQAPTLDPWAVFWPILKVVVVVAVLLIPVILLNEYLHARIRRWKPKRRR